MHYTMNHPYYNENVEDYLNDPTGHNKEAEMFGMKCMPISNINGSFMPTEKDNPDNLKMAQYNIRERFGYLSEADDMKEGG